MKKVVSINKIKERKIGKEELEENEKDYKKKKLLIYTTPLISIIVIAIIYIFTNIHYLLIPFGILFLIFLYGWDSNQRTCPECKKWNSIIWTDTKVIVETAEKPKKGLLGKYKLNKRITRNVGKCTNCGKEITIEKQRKI